MTKDRKKTRTWVKPQVTRLGELKDVRAGANPSTGNGTMS